MDLSKVKENLDKEFPHCKIIYLTLSGSKLHGTATEKSDTDIKGLMVPSIESILLNENLDLIYKGTDIANTAVDVDYEIFSIEKFLKLLNNGDAGAIDILFSMFSTGETIIYESTESYFIKDNYSRLITKQHMPFIGFALKQSSLYSVKGDRVNALDKIIEVMDRYAIPEFKKQKLKNVVVDGEYLTDILERELTEEVLNGKFFFSKMIDDKEYFNILDRNMEKNAPFEFVLKQITDLRGKYGSRAANTAAEGGKDYKAFSHAIRAIRECKEMLTTGFIQFPLAYSSHLLDIKKGLYTDRQILSNMVEAEATELEKDVEASLLPKNIDPLISSEIISNCYNIKKEKECWTFALVN